MDAMIHVDCRCVRVLAKNIECSMRQRVQRQEEYRIRLLDLDYLSRRLIIRHVSAQDSIKAPLLLARLFITPAPKMRDDQLCAHETQVLRLS